MIGAQLDIVKHDALPRKHAHVLLCVVQPRSRRGRLLEVPDGHPYRVAPLMAHIGRAELEQLPVQLSAVHLAQTNGEGRYDRQLGSLVQC